MADDGNNNRKLRDSVRDRIRSRGSVSGDSRTTNGDGRNVSGDGRNVSGDGSGTINGSGTGDDIGSHVDANQRTSDEIGDGLRIVGESVNRRTPRIRDAGSNGDNRTSDNGDGTTESGQPVSASVSINEILTPVPPRRGRGRPPKNAKTKKPNAPDYSDIVFPLSIALDFIFSIPVAVGGKQFAFWQLSDDETEELVDSLKDVLEAFPSNNTEQFIKALEKWIPLLTLGINLYTIMKPRLLLTQQIMAEKRKQIADAKNKQTKEGTTTIPFVNHSKQAIG